jgi:hypothetical protein
MLGNLPVGARISVPPGGSPQRGLPERFSRADCGNSSVPAPMRPGERWGFRAKAVPLAGESDALPPARLPRKCSPPWQIPESSCPPGPGRGRKRGWPAAIAASPAVLIPPFVDPSVFPFPANYLCLSHLWGQTFWSEYSVGRSRGVFIPLRREPPVPFEETPVFIPTFAPNPPFLDSPEWKRLTASDQSFAFFIDFHSRPTLAFS